MKEPYLLFSITKNACFRAPVIDNDDFDGNDEDSNADDDNRFTEGPRNPFPKMQAAVSNE